MQKASLADAKARLSALIDDAEHRNRKTMILRHGRPSAVIVPVEAALPKRKQTRMSKTGIKALFDALAAGGKRGAVRELLASRR